MSKLVVGAVLSLLAVLYPITWKLGVPEATRAVERELKQEVEALWRAQHTSDPMPEVRVDFGLRLPVLPGVVLINFHPSSDGKGPCVGSTAVVFWYRTGTRLLYAPWRDWHAPQLPTHGV